MEPRTEEYFRWLYTAITRASSRLHLLNPPNHPPWDAPKSLPASGPPRAPPAAVSDPDQASVMGAASSGESVLDEIFSAISARIAGVPNARIASVDHHAWQESFHVTDGESTARVNVTYNRKGVVGGFSVTPKTGFAAELARRLADIAGKQFVGGSTFVAGEQKFSREVFNEFIPLFTERLSSSSLRIASVSEEKWNLRIVLGNSVTTGELAIYCDGEERIRKYGWIGRPPGDPSFQHIVDAVMANI